MFLNQSSLHHILPPKCGVINNRSRGIIVIPGPVKNLATGITGCAACSIRTCFAGCSTGCSRKIQQLISHCKYK
jgi:hypothetical protein